MNEAVLLGILSSYLVFSYIVGWIIGSWLLAECDTKKDFHAIVRLVLFAPVMLPIAAFSVMICFYKNLD